MGYRTLPSLIKRMCQSNWRVSTIQPCMFPRLPRQCIDHSVSSRARTGARSGQSVAHPFAPRAKMLHTLLFRWTKYFMTVLLTALMSHKMHATVMREFKLRPSFARHAIPRAPPQTHQRLFTPATYRAAALARSRRTGRDNADNPLKPGAALCAPSPPRQTYRRALRVRLSPVAARGHRCALVRGAVFCFVV
jgi:hypothetical protein